MEDIKVKGCSEMGPACGGVACRPRPASPLAVPRRPVDLVGLRSERQGWAGLGWLPRRGLYLPLRRQPLRPGPARPPAQRLPRLGLECSRGRSPSSCLRGSGSYACLSSRSCGSVEEGVCVAALAGLVLHRELCRSWSNPIVRVWPCNLPRGTRRDTLLLQTCQALF